MPESGPLRLKLRDPDGQEREVSFTQDVVTIGRSHECDLPLESGFISRNHARLSFMGSGGGGWQIVDEGSKNGVFVNGQRIAGSTAVKPGDALRIGDYRVSVLPVESETPAPAEDSDVDRTLVLSPAMLRELNPPAENPAATSEKVTPSPTSTPPEQAAVPQPQEPSAATGTANASTMEQPATPPYGVTAPEPAAPVAAETPAAVTLPPAAEAVREAVPVVAETSHEAGVRTSTDAGAADRSSESGAVHGTERLMVDAEHRSVLIDGRDLTAQLTGREIDVLLALSAAGADGYGIDQLANAVWGGGGGDTEMLERLLFRLSGKVDADLIERLPGRGVRLRAAG